MQRCNSTDGIYLGEVTRVIPLHGGTFEMGLSKLHGVILLFIFMAHNKVLVKVMFLMCVDISTLQPGVLCSH